MKTPDGRPVAFRDLPRSKFPFHIQVIDDQLGTVWEATVEGATALEVPGLGPERAEHRYTRVVFADGEIQDSRD